MQKMKVTIGKHVRPHDYVEGLTMGGWADELIHEVEMAPLPTLAVTVQLMQVRDLLPGSVVSWSALLAKAAEQGLVPCSPEAGLALCEQVNMPTETVVVFPVVRATGLMFIHTHNGKLRLEGRTLSMSTSRDWFVPFVKAA